MMNSKEQTRLQDLQRKLLRLLPSTQKTLTRIVDESRLLVLEAR
ncbi:MAG: hypothetical protein ACTSU6_05470 [Candidatus Njordarchaeales archaeon]